MVMVLSCSWARDVNGRDRDETETLTIFLETRPRQDVGTSRESRPFRDRDVETDTTTLSLVQAFIHCRLDYCNALLAGITDTQLKRLQSVQTLWMKYQGIIIIIIIIIINWHFQKNAQLTKIVTKALVTTRKPSLRTEQKSLQSAFETAQRHGLMTQLRRQCVPSIRL